jgi:hypothetical protein
MLGCLNRATGLVMAALIALLALAPPAVASLSADVESGAGLVASLPRTEAACTRLAAGDFARIGEYAVDRMAGTRANHAAMDKRMGAVLGADAALRMHEQVGRRIAGCGGASPMMGATWPGWMRGYAWRAMSRSDWQRAATRTMRPGMMTAHDDGDGLWIVAAIVLAAGAIVLVARWAGHRRVTAA